MRRSKQPPVAAPIAIDTAYERLLALGAGEVNHVAGTLALHLRRTEALLRRFGNRDALTTSAVVKKSVFVPTG